MTTVFFDIDGTLLDEHDRPREEVIDLLKAFYRVGCTIGVWSGGGLHYVQRRVRQLDLESFVTYQASKTQIVEVLDAGATIFVDDRDLLIDGVEVIRV